MLYERIQQNKRSLGMTYAAALIAASCLYLLIFKDRSAIGSLALALYRCLGLPLLLVCSIMPETVQWKGRHSKHFWMQTVFGVALGDLINSLLEKAGAGIYFIRLAYAFMRGGPAKAAVVASGLSGIYSGSSANVVSTGTFTIPLMKKTGLTPEKVGVAASTNGHLTPPVIAAFLIAEFTGISYLELITHAILPAMFPILDRSWKQSN